MGARQSRRAPPDHVQHRLHVPSGGERRRVRPLSVGQSVHADGVGRRQRRRLQQRSRVHLRSVEDDDRSEPSPRRCRACSPARRARCATASKKQIGTIAGRNSCAGPVVHEPQPARVARVAGAEGLPDRATISLGIANPLTGVDALVHGSNNLHGWGAPSFADPTLLFVRGFDPTSQQYNYDVNPRFGANRQASALNLAPMQLTLDVRLDVGPERERQDLFLRLRSGRGGRGNKLTEQQIKTAVRAHLSESVRADASPAGFARPQQRHRRQHRDSRTRRTARSSTRSGRRSRSTSRRSPDKYDLDEAYDRVSTPRTSRSTRWRSTDRRRSSC